MTCSDFDAVCVDFKEEIALWDIGNRTEMSKMEKILRGVLEWEFSDFGGTDSTWQREKCNRDKAR